MIFNDARLKAAGFSNKKIERLRRRQRGGSFGQLGYAHQRYYAMTRAVEVALANPQATVWMEALCPVDDVVVVNGRRHEYCQCKISKDETWGSEGKKLEVEFKDQRRLLISNGVGVADIELKLVVSDDAQRARLDRKIPVAVQDCTTVECFPLPVPEHHHWVIPRFANALDGLLPPMVRNVSMREMLFKELNHAVGDPWQPTKVNDLLDCAGNNPHLPIIFPHRRPWSVDAATWQKALAIILAIPRLTIHLDGDVCCYSRGASQSGFLARCDTPGFAKFVKDVIHEKPATMKAFLELRPV